MTSYDCPQCLKDKINGKTDDEIRALQASVKSPNQCSAGDPDLLVWWNCSAALGEDTDDHKPGIDISQLIPWLDE